MLVRGPSSSPISCDCIKLIYTKEAALTACLEQLACLLHGEGAAYTRVTSEFSFPGSAFVSSEFAVADDETKQ